MKQSKSYLHTGPPTLNARTALSCCHSRARAKIDECACMLTCALGINVDDGGIISCHSPSFTDLHHPSLSFAILRQVLAQLSNPIAFNFSKAIAKPRLSATLVRATSGLYDMLLRDLDRLLNTDPAFMLG